MAALNMVAVIESYNEHNKLSPMTLIRELKEADFEQWLELYQVYAEHYRVALTEMGIQTTWGWLMDSSHPLQGLVAVQEVALVGMAHFRAMPSPLRGQNIGFLDDLVVHPSARGGGVGQLLLGELQRIGLQEGWGLFRWITRDNNYRARKLYDKVASKSDWNVYEMSCNNHLD